MNQRTLESLASEHGTPLLVVDHRRIRRNFREFRKRLPRVQVYYAVKANPEPEIIGTMYGLGSSFDVASLAEFNLVIGEVEKHLPLSEQQNFVWNHIIYANPVKETSSLKELNLYKPLLTYDCYEEMLRIREHCPCAGLVLRLKVDDKDSPVKFSHKFGIEPEKAVDLIARTLKAGLGVEGLSFHVGSQCNNPEQFRKALEDCSKIFRKCDKKAYVIGETVTKGYPIKLVDIGGGFPVRYNGNETPFKNLARFLNEEFDRLFPEKEYQIIAEPGRFMVANAATLIANITLAKHRGRKIPGYHINDGLYHALSGIIYDHQQPRFQSFVKGRKIKSAIFGRTCDGLDTIAGFNPDMPSLRYAHMPKLGNDDLIYAENMGAYTNASATHFNGFPPAKIVHVNV